MDKEKIINTNVQEEIKNNEVVPKQVISEEEKQLKVEEKAQKEAENNQKIEGLKSEISKQFEVSEPDSFGKWKNQEERKINEKSKEFGDETVSSGIGGRNLVYDKESAIHSLEDYGELNFIEFAAREGNTNDIDKALSMVEIYYKDRDDLKANLYINKGDFDKAKEVIINVKDKSLYFNMAHSLYELFKKRPDLRDSTMKELSDLNPEYFEDAEEEIKYQESHEQKRA